MPEDNPTPPVGGIEVTLVNENIDISINAANRNDRSVPPLTEDDRTLRAWSPQIVRRTADTGSNALTAGRDQEIIALAENDGTPMVSNYGKDSSGALQPVRVNSDDQLQIQLQGADEAGNSDSLRTDPNLILWVRPYEGWIEQPGVAVPAVEGIVYNPGTDATETYWVKYKIVNIDAGGAAVTCSVGSDATAGGSLAAAEYDMFNEVVPYPGSSGWRDLGIIAGDDDIRAVASAADDAIIRFKIRRVDTGA